MKKGARWPTVLGGVGLVALVLLLGCRQGQGIPGESSAALLQQGAQLYDANCLTCHGGATGGTMMDIPPTHNANGHTWHHPDCQLIQTVLNGSGEMGEMMRRMMGAPENTPRMPAFKGALTEEETQAILAYIKTWWREDQRRSQARATKELC